MRRALEKIGQTNFVLSFFVFFVDEARRNRATMVSTRRTRSAAAADTPAVDADGDANKATDMPAGDGDEDIDMADSHTEAASSCAEKEHNADDDADHQADDDDEGGPRKRPRTDGSTNTRTGKDEGTADASEEQETAAAAAAADEIEEFDESDDEVEIMSPPRNSQSQSQPQSQSQSQSQHSQSQHSQSATAAANANGANGDLTDDEIQIESCNVMNPAVHYAHTRDMCGVHRFDASGKDAVLNRKHCAKCYCFVCDVEAGQCTEWEEGHCHASSQDVTWKAIRQSKKNRAALAGGGDAAAGASGNGGDVVVLDSDDGTSPAGAAATATSVAASRRRMQMVAAASAAAANRQRARERMEVLANIMGGSVAPVVMPPGLAGASSAARTKQVNDLVAEALGGAVNSGRSDGEGSAGERRTKTREQMRITEVLSENFRRVLTLTSGTNGAGDSASSAAGSVSLSSTQSRRKMEGDIPQLGLHGSFFVEGIKIGWPFPMVMQPQRQMAIHLIKALKNRRHVVLESPTGTGKSAAILCSILAWQRYHAKTAEGRTDTPRIIYCSRTHSQVAQMVASLKKTPYRPRMAILGSRERMCIHKDLRPRAKADKSSDKNINVNNECRVRVRNTEKSRKQMWRSDTQGYDDDKPPVDVTGDRAADATAAAGTQEGEAAEANDASDDGFRSKNRKMCPHYRQLTSNRVAALAHSMFTPNEKAVECCSLGGEQTKFGAHDIEDLVNFGVTPHTLSGVAIYRGNSSSVGLQLSEVAGSGCCKIGKVKEGAAKVEGTLREDDRLAKFNGEDVRHLPLADVANRFRNATQDPITLDVVRGDVEETDGDDYSPHSACPYYLSQILARNAELVFAPYNYVLEPAIRNALGIELEGSIIVLDEDHNVEDTLRESGSCKLGEFELCELLLVMSNYSSMEKHHANLIKVNHPGTAIPIPDNEYAPSGRGGDVPDGSMYISDVAHCILLFLERIIDFLRSSRDRFEKNPGNKGADAAIREYRKFHSPDDKAFQVTYDGPTGMGVGGKAVGCKPFFDRLQFRQGELEQVVAYAEALSEHVRSRSEEQGERSMNQMDRLLELVAKFSAASQKPEHFYVASVVAPNGSFAHAAGDDDESGDGPPSRFKKKPKQLPFAPPRTQAYPNRTVNPCNHDVCRRRSAGNAFDVVRHGSYCNGSTPRWEATLVLNLLSPGLPMRQLADQCRTVVLASGSLAPLPSLCGELNLFPPKEGIQNIKPSAALDTKVSATSTEVDLERYGRLQVHPKPLEANHVVNLPKQLLAMSVGHFPDGSPLSVKYSNYSKPGFIGKLGDAVATLIESIPSGGVLVFLPSYSFLRKCANSWNPNNSRRRQFRFGSQYEEDSDVWDRILESKGKIIVEETGSQEKFEKARTEYNETVRTRGSCVLFAVYRGKMSEGVSFNDDYARGVICVGLPLPNAYDMSIKAKKSYNNEQRRLRKRNNLLPGDDWYQQQAYRAIAQALGRCIRHAGDYGTIVLLDSRHCDDGSPSLDGICSAHRQLPKWMRHVVRNLVKARRGGMGAMDQFLSPAESKQIQGGWNGLASEMKRFFREAKPYAASVLAGHQAKLEKAKERDRTAQGRKFDTKTGTWSSSTTSSKGPANFSSSVSLTAPSSASAAAVPAEAAGAQATSSTTATASSATSSASIATSTPSTKMVEKSGTTAGVSAASAAASISESSQPTAQPTPSTSINANPYVSQAKSGSTASKSQYLSSRERIQRALPQKKAPNTLHAMFNRQRSAVAPESGTCSSAVTETPAAAVQVQAAPSPAVGTNLGSALKATSSSSAAAVSAVAAVGPPVGDGSQPIAPPFSAAEEENLCVICEEATKRVVLLPCKHLCLCSACSKLEQVTDCPMCRTKISDKMEVFT